MTPILFYAFVGCVVGTLVGVLPGVGPLAGISLLLPATFGLDAKQGEEFQKFLDADAHRLAEGVRKVGRIETK